MYKIKIHPLFFAAALIYIVLGKADVVLCCFGAVLLHEVAHSRMAKYRGYVMNEIVLMPYGALLKNKSDLESKDAISIALAGPLFNLFSALCCVALWWLVPSSYNFTLIFCEVNLAIGLFNLIPVYPLDGSRILKSLMKNRNRAHRLMKAGGILLAAALFAGSIVTIFFGFNMSFAVMSVFLFYGAVFGADKEEFLHMAGDTPFSKKLMHGLEIKSVMVSEKMPLYKCLRFVKSNAVTSFVVADAERKRVAAFEERELEAMCVENDLKTPVGVAVRKKPKVK